VSGFPDAAREVLDRGVLCHLAAPSPAGPHVTPVVFVFDGGRVWGTTSRGTAKARRWRRQPVAGGLVTHADRTLTFRGRVTMYDLLDASTWRDSLVRAPLVARASARFTLKNARFFAGYARDVARVPLAWTPPARVVFSIDLEAGAVLQGDRVAERWGSWGRGIGGRTGYRALRDGGLPEGDLPEEARALLGRRGEGVVGLAGPGGPVVLPARWVRSGGAFLAVLPRPIASLAAPRPDGAASLVIDAASTWRAARMRGVLLRGDASVFAAGEVRTGREALLRAIAPAGKVPSDPAVIRLRPRTAVWWEGWASGTVGRP
jgi:nitroimidazol reductase NimA-like FMN-containing flavoprotein (pyridoxamine 5'-phosphate oxidase superfamily)